MAAGTGDRLAGAELSAPTARQGRRTVGRKRRFRRPALPGRRCCARDWGRAPICANTSGEGNSNPTVEGGGTSLVDAPPSPGRPNPIGRSCNHLLPSHKRSIPGWLGSACHPTEVLISPTLSSDDCA